MKLKRFDEFITEGLKDINELGKLADELLEYFARSNADMVDKFKEDEKYNDIKFNEDRCIISNVVDENKYDLLKDFIINSGGIVIITESSSHGGKFSIVPKDRQKEFSVIYGILINNVKDDFIEELKYDINSMKTTPSYVILFSTIRTLMRDTLIHELQHAYDDFRSKGKFVTDKKTIEYRKRILSGEKFTSQDKDDEFYQLYLSLPHEYYARFSAYIQKCNFYKQFIQVADNFKYDFVGYNTLSESDKKKLLKSLYKVWFEKNEQRRINIEKINKIKSGKS